jgi:hypothetical protein
MKNDELSGQFNALSKYPSSFVLIQDVQGIRDPVVVPWRIGEPLRAAQVKDNGIQLSAFIVGGMTRPEIIPDAYCVKVGGSWSAGPVSDFITLSIVYENSIRVVSIPEGTEMTPQQLFTLAGVEYDPSLDILVAGEEVTWPYTFNDDSVVVIGASSGGGSNYVDITFRPRHIIHHNGNDVAVDTAWDEVGTDGSLMVKTVNAASSPVRVVFDHTIDVTQPTGQIPGSMITNTYSGGGTYSYGRSTRGVFLYINGVRKSVTSFSGSLNWCEKKRNGNSYDLPTLSETWDYASHRTFTNYGPTAGLIKGVDDKMGIRIGNTTDLGYGVTSVSFYQCINVIGAIQGPIDFTVAFE